MVITKVIKKGIIGFGKTGISIAKFLLKKGDDIVIFDSDITKTDLLKSDPSFEFALKKGQVRFLPLPSNYIEAQVAIQTFKDFEILYVSPGVPAQQMNLHPIIQAAIDCDIKISSDMDLYYEQYCSKKRGVREIIGITGTNGKSTTAYLTYFLLKSLLKNKDHSEKSDIEIALLGNIGYPVLASLDEISESNIIRRIDVLELSSYQLDLASTLQLDIAVCLSITPDHIERYGSMENYRQSKLSIFNKVKSDGYVIASLDDINKIELEGILSGRNAIKKIFISNDYSNKDWQLNISNNIFNIRNFPGIDDISLQLPVTNHITVEHNRINLCVSIAICLLKGLKLDVILKILPEFHGLRHRAELVGTCSEKGLRFINDSKATNMSAAASSLMSFSPAHWIVGGKDKGSCISEIKDSFKFAIAAYLVGETTDAFAEIFKKEGILYYKCYTIEAALDKIKAIITDREKIKDEGGAKHSNTANTKLSLEENILLAPACSSFDQWANFEARGDGFVNHIKNLWELD